MGRKKARHPRFESLEIIDIAAEGKAIAKIDNKVVFVTGVIPGDVVDVQINKKKRSYLEGYPVKFHTYSSEREEAFCSHFGVCGGCKWQMLPYEKQLHYKQTQVHDQLKHIGGFEFPEISPILGSAKTQYYRNKLEFTFSNNRWLTKEEIDENEENPDVRALGFHIPKMFDRIVNVDHCYLQGDPSNKIRTTIMDFAVANDYTFYDPRKQEGLLRNLIIRTSTTGEVMIIVIFLHDEQEQIKMMMQHIKENISEASCLMYVVNGKVNDTITDQDIILFDGRDHIFEEMEGLKFKIGPKSFYQTNSEQAYELYKITREFASLSGNEVVYDLYTGTGTIANFVARQSKKVIGIEYVPEAIEDAKVNSGLNGIENTSFYAGDMKDILTNEFIFENGKPEVIILDPPRAGVHPKVVDAIKFADAIRLVYVSCNPATQARDIALLSDKYKVTRVQPVDMFPHTHHVENVVLLEKINPEIS